MSPLSTSERLIRDQFKADRASAGRFVALYEWVAATLEGNGLELEPEPPEVGEARRIMAMRDIYEQSAEQRERTRLAKLAKLHPPPTRTGDGSREVRPPEGDPWAKAFVRDEVLAARGQQALKHQEMAKAGYVPGDADAHHSTRAIRAEMYRRWQREETNARKDSS